MREAREGAVGQAEVRRLAELVESMLRREAQWDARGRSCEQPIRVGMHEMRMQDHRSHTREVRGEPHERNRIEIGTKGNRVERDAAGAQCSGEIPCTWLVLVQHE